MKESWIARPEGGGRLAIRLLTAFALACGRPAARAVLYAVALYFMMRRGPERRASRAFLSRVFGRRATSVEVYRHILCFSRVTLDRLFLLHDGVDRFHVESSGLDDAHAAMARGRGVLMFGAHFGSFEVMRVLATKRPDLRFRNVIDLEQAPAMSRLLSTLNPELAATVINARQSGHAVALAIKEALDQGAAVTLLADRLRPGGRSIGVGFLGSQAAFPAAPWEIASVLGVPVVLCFGVYLGGNRYHLHFELVTERIMRERAGGTPLPEWVQQFADRLARQVRSAPYNWSNFYDFWAG